METITFGAFMGVFTNITYFQPRKKVNYILFSFLTKMFPLLNLFILMSKFFMLSLRGWML